MTLKMQDPIDRLERIVETMAAQHQDLAVKMSEFVGKVDASMTNQNNFISAVDRKIDEHILNGRENFWRTVSLIAACLGGGGSVGAAIEFFIRR